MGRKVLIVGGVAGGATAAARLRRIDESAEIIVFERGEYISYANCGLPYHIGNVIKARSSLLLLTPEAMHIKYNIDVRIKQEVVSIDRSAKTVKVKRVDTGEIYEESYDKLVLSTGSSPIRPAIPGIDNPKIMNLWTVPDTDRVKNYISDKKPKNALVVGGGFIGLEMAENLREAGLEVMIVEKAGHVMGPLDQEMAELLHENIEQNGVSLNMLCGVEAFKEVNGELITQFTSGKEMKTDLVMLAIGVRPNSELAADAGLKLNSRGGIITDEYMRTEDPDIYAVGDVIEVKDFYDGSGVMRPLAGPANKQGRIAADNICGGHEKYNGTQGTSIAKVFDLSVATTGVNEDTLISRGLVKGKDYERAIIITNSHASYYPGATTLALKLLFSMDGKKIFGAQIVGRDGVDKRIDTLAVAIRLGGSIYDLKELELAYAPPYSSAKDPVNMVGFVADNILSGTVSFSDWDSVENNPDSFVLDVREPIERLAYSVPGSVGIPLGELRGRLGEIDKTKEINVFCAIGVRAYNAARILMQSGFENVKVYPGGTRYYMSTHYKYIKNEETSTHVDDVGKEEKELPKASMRIDCSGMQCPGPLMKVFETMKGMNEGEIMEVSASDPGFSRDIGAWARRTGNTLLSNEHQGIDYVATIKKGIGKTEEKNVVSLPDGKTIIVFSGDLDKVLASFIIANGAAAMGREVTMFFTFWGLNVLRKSEKQDVKKSMIEGMFGSMMPRGMGRLKLSKMNMGGLGTAMMKKVMKDKNIDTLEDLVKKAMANGVKIIACTMSMDVMGIKQEELIDGVELGGVGAYLGDAEESNVNLFI
jgi:NADPH-dependent 2,4-dienoyl-CoA reductase/sulfur reductase-like enzyme/peroxiredoxin family protein/TusA-related sulfurtransferase/rhodanese-related sulfurtransferase